MRALALLPLELAMREAGRPFAATDVTDIISTIAVVARHWRDGERCWNAIWDVMARQRSTVGDVIDAFRQHLGGPKWRMPCRPGLWRLRRAQAISLPIWAGPHLSALRRFERCGGVWRVTLNPGSRQQV
jgi:hypothetical protein